MQTSATAASVLNPFAAASAGGQAVGATPGLEGLLAGLFGGEEASTETGTADAFSEALAAAMFAPAPAQPVPAAPAVKPEGGAEAAVIPAAPAPAATQAIVFSPSLLSEEQPAAAPAVVNVDAEFAESFTPIVSDTSAQATDADLKLAFAAAKDTVAPAAAAKETFAAPAQAQAQTSVSAPAVSTPAAQPPVAAPPVDPANAPEAAVAVAATATATARQAEAPPQVEAQAAVQVAAAQRPTAPQAEHNTKTAAKTKSAAPAGEARGEPRPAGQPAAASAEPTAAAAAPAPLDGADTDFAALPDAPTNDVAPDAPSPHAASHHEVRAAAAPVVETPRATTQTVAHLAAQITSKLDGKSTRFDVQLDPHGLGKVDVKVEIAANGSVSAALTFENPQSAAELRGRQGELQAALEQAGFDLSKTSLSFSSGGQGQQGLFDQHQQQAQTPVWRGRAFTDLSDTPETALAPVRQRATTGVDVRI